MDIQHSFGNVSLYQRKYNGNVIFQMRGLLSRYKSKQANSRLKYIISLSFGNEKLNGLIWHCTCKNGLRTTNPCSHITAFLIFILLVQNNQSITDLQTIHHQTVLNTIMDCYKYKQWFKKNSNYCICEIPETSDLLIQCKLCKEKYHPSCLGLSDDIKYDEENWYCTYCKEEEIDDSNNSEGTNMDVNVNINMNMDTNVNATDVELDDDDDDDDDDDVEDFNATYFRNQTIGQVRHQRSERIDVASSKRLQRTNIVDYKKFF